MNQDELMQLAAKVGRGEATPEERGFYFEEMTRLSKDLKSMIEFAKNTNAGFLGEK